MFLDKLNSLMAERQINRNILSKETGIPYTTIDAFYKKGYENMKLSTLKKLCRYFKVSLDYLVDSDDAVTQFVVTESEYGLIEDFRSLGEENQNIIRHKIRAMKSKQLVRKLLDEQAKTGRAVAFGGDSIETPPANEELLSKIRSLLDDLSE